MRRWQAPWFRVIDGVAFRVIEGKKEPGDLRVEWRTPAGWKPITMAPIAMLVEFFIENEEHLRQYRPHWRQTGHDFFMAYLETAFREGWEAAYASILADREAIARPRLEVVSDLDSSEFAAAWDAAIRR